MTIRFEYFNNVTSSHGATIALEHKLYIPGWDLSNALVNTARNRNAGRLVIAYDYDIPVGVLHITPNMHVMAFVVKGYRGQGIGKQMVQVAMKYFPELDWSQRFARPGIEGSIAFWKSCNVCMEDDAYAFHPDDIEKYRNDYQLGDVIAKIDIFAKIIYENKRRLNGVIT